MVSRDWEEMFRAWARPPSQTEIDRCDNAVSVVRNAIRSYVVFAMRDVAVFAQGSYRNGTNVRADSDVDVCVCCKDVCFSDRADGISQADTQLVDASYTYSEFKDDVEQALCSYLGNSAVSRGNKAFDLHANSYRVDADVVPTFEHRRYYRNVDGQIRYITGTELRPNNGGRIINWPEQNYSNGVDKNKKTTERFKKVVRILKHVKNEMEEQGVKTASQVPSYLVECLVWNVLNEEFGNTTFTADVRNTLVYLYSKTKSEEECNAWGEVNELKYLFRASQPWRRENAHAFVLAAWGHCDLE